MLKLIEINELVDSWMCSAACRDSKSVKFGRIDKGLRKTLISVSIAREFSSDWTKEQIEEYKCWLYERLGIL